MLPETSLNYSLRESKKDDPDFSLIPPTVLNELEDVVEKLEKWEKKVFDEEEDMQIRGGGILNAFENPEDASWLFKKN